MAIPTGHRVAFAALLALALVCGAQSQTGTCTVNAVPNFQPCGPGSKVGTPCGANCSGGCNGSCEKSGAALLCAPCYDIGQPCCPGTKPGDICAITGCGGGGCGYKGTCVGSGTGRQLMCKACGLKIGGPCCQGNKPGSACGPYYFTGPVTGHTGYCDAKMMCTACPPGKPCPPPPPLTCSAVYGQCGGRNWTGPKCCAAGSTCIPQVDKNGNVNVYYSQCLPKKA